jgi:hypothetical protein
VIVEAGKSVLFATWVTDTAAEQEATSIIAAITAAATGISANQTCFFKRKPQNQVNFLPFNL